jgi:hypothetical protein
MLCFKKSATIGKRECSRWGRVERVGKKSKAGSVEMRGEKKPIGRQGSGVCCFGSLVVATRRCVSILMLEMMNE